MGMVNPSMDFRLLNWQVLAASGIAKRIASQRSENNYETSSYRRIQQLNNGCILFRRVNLYSL